MAASTSRMGRSLWNLEIEAPQHESKSREKETVEEEVDVFAGVIFQTPHIRRNGKERALSFFWKRVSALERKPPVEAMGATKRKWAFLVRETANKLESGMLASSKHRLWKPLRYRKSEAVSKVIVETVFRNR